MPTARRARRLVEVEPAAGHDRAIEAGVSVAGRRSTIRIGSTHPLGAPGNALLAATLLPAMRSGARLRVSDPIGPQLARSLPTIQRTLAGWSRLFRPVDVDAPVSPAAGEPGPGLGCLFSGGVDSFYSLLTRRAEVTHLVLVHGFDIALDNTHLRRRASFMARSVADDLGKDLIEVETNVQALFGLFRVPWVWAHGSAMAAVALALRPVIRGAIFASSRPTWELTPWGSHPRLDPLWSADGVSITHDGDDASRTDKIRFLADQDLAMRWLRICWENRHGAYNCGQCGKCVRAMAILDSLGALERCSTLPDRVAVEDLRRMPLSRTNVVLAARETLAAVRDAGGDPEVERAIRHALRMRHLRRVRSQLVGFREHRLRRSR